MQNSLLEVEIEEYNGEPFTLERVKLVDVLSVTGLITSLFVLSVLWVTSVSTQEAGIALVFTVILGPITWVSYQSLRKTVKLTANGIEISVSKRPPSLIRYDDVATIERVIPLWVWLFNGLSLLAGDHGAAVLVTLTFYDAQGHLLLKKNAPCGYGAIPYQFVLWRYAPHLRSQIETEVSEEALLKWLDGRRTIYEKNKKTAHSSNGQLYWRGLAKMLFWCGVITLSLAVLSSFTNPLPWSEKIEDMLLIYLSLIGIGFFGTLSAFSSNYLNDAFNTKDKLT